MNLLKLKQLNITGGYINLEIKDALIKTDFHRLTLPPSVDISQSSDNTKLETLIWDINYSSGRGLGTVDILSVSYPSEESLSNMAISKFSNYNHIVWDYLRTFETNKADFIQSTAKIAIAPFQHISNIDESMKQDVTEVGSSNYSNVYEWDSKYGISQLKGTNDFPTMGWAGSLIGSTTGSSELENTLYVWPFKYLPIKPLIPDGIVMAGQGVQYNESQSIIPYQQGRGAYEYIYREPRYINGIISSLDIISTYAPEGAVAGRNNFFVGVALTNRSGDTLNVSNHQTGSITPADTKIIKEPARPSPLTLTSNVDRKLPWSNVWNYHNGEKIGILREGFTPMTISGVYPFYRGAWNSEFTGRNSLSAVGATGRWWSRGLSQYYIDDEFWDHTTAATSISADTATVTNYKDPKNPFRIKGAKIVLLEGQRIIAGSYVYSTISMVGNVNISKYFPESAKEIFLPSGKVLLSDPYARYQSNQGSLIVVATVEGEDPPMPVSNAQPIGIVLETVEGEGTYETLAMGTPARYTEMDNISDDVQNAITGEKVISNRDINIMLYPMYSQEWTSAISGVYGIQGIPYGTTVATRLIADDVDNWEDADLPVLAPRYERIRNNYMIPDSPYAYSYAYDDDLSNNDSLALYGNRMNTQYTLTAREKSMDWPGPHGSIDVKE